MRLRVATIAAPVGLRGHVRLKMHTDAPAERFYPGALLLTDSGELEIVDVRGNGRSWQLAFSGHQSREAAEALRDTVLYVETDEQEAEDEAFYYHELVGLPAVTPTGEPLGEIRGVQALPAQDVLEVKTPSGMVLVPFVAEIVPEIAADRIIIDPPGGLFA